MVNRERDPYKYQTGFGNQHATEALPDTLPAGCNTPQKCPRGLIAEQLSGTAFTKPRDGNERTWIYRVHPSVGHNPFSPDAARAPKWISDFTGAVVDPNQKRWSAWPIPGSGDGEVDFVRGMTTICGSGSAETKTGCAVHIYACNASMPATSSFADADGDLLIVAQQGALDVTTELGRMWIEPGEIFVVPRGVRFSVALPDGPSRGYVCEVFQGHFRIPDLGPIGANGLANPRDFEYPTAWYNPDEAKLGREGGPARVDGAHSVTHKFLGQFFTATQAHTPFDVVAWHGNYAPYKYDLDKFCTVNAVAFDHLDPSIFTVITCPTAEPGVAVIDLAIFPPRWCVQDNTFRPPYYHRNLMSEYMGLIRGVYDAKAEGFVPGGGSLHSCMSPHGPDAETFKKASEAELVPAKMQDTMAFMFESTFVWRLTEEAARSSTVQKDYYKCWQGIPNSFKGEENN